MSHYAPRYASNPFDLIESFIHNRRQRVALTISQGKPMFYENGCLAISDLFHMFTQSIKFYTLCYHAFKEYRFLKNAIHQVDSKN